MAVTDIVYNEEDPFLVERPTNNIGTPIDINVESNQLISEIPIRRQVVGVNE